MNGWEEWSKFILSELTRLADGMERIEARLGGMDTRLRKVEWIQRGILGAGTVMLTIAVSLTVAALKKLAGV